MLTDAQRKLLAILRNYSTTHGHVPPLHFLKAKTGKPEGGINGALYGLAEKRYVQWKPDQSVEDLLILRAWSNELRLEQPPQQTEKPWYDYLTDPKSP